MLSKILGHVQESKPAPPKKRYAKSAAAYFEIINEALETTPWFGQPPYEVTFRKTPPQNVSENLPYIRRILLSWLIGRPIKDISKRTGCSDSLVRRIIREQVYASQPNLQEWNRLGLIGLVGAPICRFDEEEFMEIVGEEVYWSTNPEEPVAVCFICHRMIGWIEGGIDMFPHSGTLADLQAESVEWRQFEAHAVQGHLITHFWLEPKMIAIPNERPLDQLTEFLGRADLAKAAGNRLKAKKATARRRYWWNMIDSRAWDQISSWQDDNSPRLLPVRDGREISETQAEREWSASLRGKFD